MLISTIQTSLKAKKIAQNYNIPIVASWRLNERHYGDLVGLSKEGAERLFGTDDLSKWRNSWSTRPPVMSGRRRAQWLRLAHCQMITKVKYPSNIKGTFEARGDTTHDILEKDIVPSSQTQMPLSESMSDTYNRIRPLWTQGIAPRIQQGQNVLLVAHANTIRSLLHLLDPENVTRDGMKKIKIPSAKPLVYTFREWRGSRQEGQKEVAGRLVRLGRDGNDFSSNRIEGTTLEANMMNTTTLDGYWVEDEDIENLSFCTHVGLQMGEQDIA